MVFKRNAWIGFLGLLEHFGSWFVTLLRRACGPGGVGFDMSMVSLCLSKVPKLDGHPLDRLTTFATLGCLVGVLRSV